MISKSSIKLIKSLALKKFRVKENLFVVEGDKIVSEVLQSEFKIKKLYATKQFISENNIYIPSSNITELSRDEIRKASLLKNPQNALAICYIPEKNIQLKSFTSELTLYLDCIQNPGNLGTIIRICDWFGIDSIFCSLDTADVYNPKTIQATMGSFCRVKIVYSHFKDIIDSEYMNDFTVYGAFLEGENLFKITPAKKSLIVIGNEGKGIQQEVERFVTKKINIPSFTKSSVGPESLNAAVATGVICAQFKQKQYYSK